MAWLTQWVPGYGADEKPIFSVLAKRTYRYGPGAKAARMRDDDPEGFPFFEKDEYYRPDAPMRSAMKHESELVAYKPLCDVILHACARPPRGKQAFHLDCGIKVGETSKLLRAFGNRHVYLKPGGLAFSEPEAFEAVRLDYGHAFGGASPGGAGGGGSEGGKGDDEAAPLFYPRNPVGKGFIVGGKPETWQGLALPNLEAPEALLTPAHLSLTRYEDWRRLPEPAAFGFMPRHAHPRWQMAGMNKKDWLEAEASRKMKLEAQVEVGAAHGHEPPPARLLHPEFHNGAPPGLRFPSLKGSEPVKLRYLDPDYPLFEFQLPDDKPAIWVDVGRGRQFLPAQLQTIEIYHETRQCTLLWRGSARYGGPESLRAFTKLEFGAEDA